MYMQANLQAQQAKIERVQYRALRFVYNDFKASYGMLRERSGLSHLNTRRIRLLLIEIYKMYHCISPQYLHNIIAKPGGILITRNNFRLNQPHFVLRHHRDHMV